MTGQVVPDLESLQTAVHHALAAWAAPEALADSPLDSLLIARTGGVNPDNQVQARRELLLDALAELAQQNELGANVLRRRFIEGHITRQVAVQLHASPDQVNRWQRSALAALTAILHNRETAVRQAKMAALKATLPLPPSVPLFGFDAIRDNLTAQLLPPRPALIAAIAGIGGIGKTSLAAAVLRQILPTGAFNQPIWLRVTRQNLQGTPAAPAVVVDAILAMLAEALWPGQSGGDDPRQRLARLQQALKAEPYLVIIDNLEIESHLEALLATLVDLVDPARFLLTTRARPPAPYSVLTYTLEELPLADATALVRHQATAIGLPELAQAPPATLEQIYAVTGGNPLALKLVVSLAAVLPLAHILEDLGHSRQGPVEELYRHIFWEAWRTLSPPGRDLLQAMPLVADEGALPEQMMAISGLAEKEFWTAVQELAARSLLDVRGTIEERRYGIHRLTETFLRTEIIHWPEA